MKYKKKRRQLLESSFPKELLVGLTISLLIPAGVLFGPAILDNKPENPDIIVYRINKCSCVADWISHLKEQGLSVIVNDEPFLSTRRKNKGVPKEFSACHTAIAGTYFVEGHVPVRDIKKLIIEKPDILGIALPGTLKQSTGEKTESYPHEVIAFYRQGGFKLFK